MAVTVTQDVGDFDLLEPIAAVVADLDPTGFERWNTVVQFESRSRDIVHLVVHSGVVSARPGGHPAPRTLVQATREALFEVFLGQRDVTHQFAHGGMRVLAGDYYDMLLLSRSLGRLRRSRQERA